MKRTGLPIRYIYTIACPFSGHVVYVGKSYDPLKRWEGHINSPVLHVGVWCRAMLSIGKEPIFSVIDSTFASGEELEVHYIAQYKHLNQANFNIGPHRGQGPMKLRPTYTRAQQRLSIYTNGNKEKRWSATRGWCQAEKQSENSNQLRYRPVAQG